MTFASCGIKTGQLNWLFSFSKVCRWKLKPANITFKVNAVHRSDVQFSVRHAKNLTASKVYVREINYRKKKKLRCGLEDNENYISKTSGYQPQFMRLPISVKKAFEKMKTFQSRKKHCSFIVFSIFQTFKVLDFCQKNLIIWAGKNIFEEEYHLIPILLRFFNR